MSHDDDLKSSGSPSSIAAEVRRDARDVRQRDADEQRRHRDDEAGDRTGDADVEQHRAWSGIGSRMRMNAPSVPVERSGTGRKNGSDASTS